jgi:hypothetical protein
MSRQAHESAAEEHARSSAEHSAQYDEKALTDPGDCSQYLGSCWGSNPTEPHKDRAEEQRRAAAAHRAAAKSLQDVEARACQGVSESDRDISPFFHRQAIVEVKPFTRERLEFAERSSASEEGAGATIVLLPAPGVTAERLQRTIECHVARNATLGYDMPEMAYCPLAIKGATATVSSTGNAFAVNITAEDQKAADAILQRARALR